MKNYPLYLWLLFVVISCNTKDKIIEKQQENLLMLALTSGQWTVTNFVQGGNDITPAFVSYKFQFRNNYTVDAINNGMIEKTGSWLAEGNTQAQTMTSNFANSTHPLILLNGTWNIITTTWTSVKASKMVNNEVYTLMLNKQ